METGIHISISAEQLFTVSGFSVSNSIFTSVLVSGVLILLALLINLQLKQTNKPTGIQNSAEWIVESLYNLVQSVTNDHKKTNLFFPLIATFFLFILLNNWFGLIPGVGTIGFIHESTTSQHAQAMDQQVSELEDTHQAADQAAFSLSTDVHAAEVTPTDHTAEQTADEHAVEVDQAHQSDHAETEEHHVTFLPLFRPGTADLNTTLALALISVIMTQIFGVMHLQLSYFSKFINFSNPIMFFVGILEIISEFAKIVSFAFRLFGNIFAGEVLLVVMTFLVPLVVPMPFYGLEIFVGLIQALVFAMLSLVFFNMATISHDEH